MSKSRNVLAGSPPRSNARRRPQRGMALVITLSILVLMIGLVMAFFSRVLLDRTIRGASAARDQSVVLARSATAIIVGDLLQEIAAGSEADPNKPVGDGVAYFSPLTAQTPYTLLGSTIRVSKMPSIVPQKNVSEPLAAAHPNLLKQSRSGEPFFVIPDGADTGYALRPGIGTPSARASAVSTTNSFQQTRAIPATSWEWPGLGHAAPPANSAPDWIYLDRSGNTPVFASNEVSTAKEQAATNPDFVIGRFAYRVYDVGGLLDLNQFGDFANPDGGGNRASLANLPLDPPPELPGLAGADLLSLAEWREGDADGSREFVSRREMLRTLTAEGELPSEVSRWFNVGSKFTERPSSRIDPELIAATPANLNADTINPPLPAIRFASEADLERGSEEAVTVAAGSPLLARKFPLSKIELLSDPEVDDADLKYYFGLARHFDDSVPPKWDGSFRYTAANAAGVIKTLAEVAVETPSREPNFFEVLQAVIATGSLGRDAGNTYSLDHPRDGLRSIQTWQIGANIIDQWDTNDLPTTIRWQNPLTGVWEPIHGVENLPYINSIAFIGHRPTWDRDRFQIWAVFDLWNPHQNAGTPPADIGGFRIRARSGQLRVAISYQIHMTSVQNPDGPGKLGSIVQSASVRPPAMPVQNVVALNANRTISIPANIDARQPVLAGVSGPPDAADWAGGLLLCDHPNLPPAVPPEIETLVGNSAYDSLISDLDQYLTKFGMTKIGELGPNGIIGTFGAKAHNYFDFSASAGNKVVFDLEYFHTPSNRWISYQSVDDIMPMSNDPLGGGLRGNSSSSGSVAAQPQPISDFLADTLISENPANTELSFYGWRFELPTDTETADSTRQGLTMVKFDPRTVRFGHNELRRLQRGRTIRQSIGIPGYPTGSGENVYRDRNAGWLMLDRRGDFTAGLGSRNNGLPYVLQPTDAMDWHPINNHYAPFGFIANIPELPALSSNINPSRYRDRDGVIRPGDGYLGAVPTAVTSPAQDPDPILNSPGKGGRGDRPVVLNRPFVSVGEMGYAFRDLPWKSLDFFTRNSGDLGLLDAFTIDPVEGDTPVVEGKVNLNSVSAPVLAALLQGSERMPYDATPNPLTVIPNPLTELEATTLAETIVDEREANGPFSDVGDVVRRALTPTAHHVGGGSSPPTVLPTDLRKAEREAAIRTLSALGDTRTWNLLIDLVVQPGRFGLAATSPDQFQAKGEKRYWVHVSLDRFTGELVQQHWEPVYE